MTTEPTPPGNQGIGVIATVYCVVMGAMIVGGTLATKLERNNKAVYGRF